MDVKKNTCLISRCVLLVVFSIALLTSIVAANYSILNSVSAQTKKTPNDEKKNDFYVLYTKDQLKYGLGTPLFLSNDEMNELNSILNLVTPIANHDQGINSKLQKLKDRLDAILSEDEKHLAPLPKSEQKQIEKEDQKSSQAHKPLKNMDCKNGDVLKGASNAKDLQVLSNCELAVGQVKHTKKMGDGDYKFLLKLDSKYNFLLNKKNEKKTGGYLVVEIVPKDQDSKKLDLPKSGDKVMVWGAWVTDKPKGWHEIHPAWKVVIQ